MFFWNFCFFEIYNSFEIFLSCCNAFKVNIVNSNKKQLLSPCMLARLSLNWLKYIFNSRSVKVRLVLSISF